MGYKFNGYRRGHPTSYAEPGGSRLKVELLVPSPDESYPAILVPELKAHAQGLPFLRYLLANSQEAPLLSPHGVVMVRIPAPERYAIHKLIVSQLRGTVSAKAAKDLRQAATLIEAVVERFPGAVEEALSDAPKSSALSSPWNRGARASSARCCRCGLGCAQATSELTEVLQGEHRHVSS